MAEQRFGLVGDVNMLAAPGITEDLARSSTRAATTS